MKTDAIHPLKTNARVLLSSVFGPYARDDEYGSRKINPMELHTRAGRLFTTDVSPNVLAFDDSGQY